MIVGIDLGTTNSLAAVWREGEPRLVPNALGEFLTPSIVAVDDNGEILIGRPAAERMTTTPDLTAALFKRQMGTNKTTRLGNREFRPEEGLRSFVSAAGNPFPGVRPRRRNVRRHDRGVV